ncbi:MULTISPECIES: type I restriction-modification system subunit M [unclassified Sphingobium]|uniref:type I restriction-modification system subunit M n=1 Tax=unclassified Sphingobium TaxID=2611147 RepID=UPI00222568B6|nr:MULTISPECIES: class I SAM-dependent DNA methyltransferase [unclassified Sphingobium]MCW2410406.1 type I restriction enzyme M protein [Sphingobium sp. B8D3D]MCW2413901.1 type I restriction enzyme M protein [Sphingobium sp. B8D3A]
MLTGEIRSQINKLRDDLWAGGVSNPLTGVEQITYLLFAKRLDDIQLREEAKAAALKRPLARRIFPEGKDGLDTPQFRDGGCPYELLRWSKFKNEAPERMYEIVADHLMPFLRGLGGAESVMASHMKGARLAFTRPGLLDKLVQGLDKIQMDDRDTKGDVYEYLLSMISSAGENGQFRTPRHIIDLIVRLMNPGPDDTVCDPACGTAGFLMMAAEHVRREHPGLFYDEASRTHFETRAFTGYDFDETMLRIGAMNMMLHGIEEPRIAYRDSLAEGGGDDAGQYSMILANPPFAGSLDNESCSKDLLKVVSTKKTELLFLALFLRMLQTGGRAAVIVPDGVLFGSSKAHKGLRQKLVDDHRLEAVISLPSGVFRPYAGVSTGILVFTKTGRGGTDKVWYYDMAADGWSLDDKRNPLLDESLLGPAPARALTEEEHAKNNLPDLLTRWAERGGAECDNPRTAQSFCVSREDIVAAGYDLSINRYKEVVHAEVEHAAPADIIRELRALEEEIAKGLTALEGMLA